MKIAKDPDWLAMVGKRLEVLQTALGKSQADMARILGISAQRLNNYQRGSRPFDVALAIILCERFDVTLDYLYRGVMGGLPFWLNQRVAELDGRSVIDRREGPPTRN